MSANLITYREHYDPHWQSYLEPDVFASLKALPAGEQISILDLAEGLARQENQTIATIILRRHLEAAIDKEKERLRLEAERQAADKLQARLSALQEGYAKYDVEAVRTLTDEEFAHALAYCQRQREQQLAAVREAERKAQAEKEAAERKAAQERATAEAEAVKRLEAERLAKEAAEKAAQRKIKDAALFELIKASYPTIESAWVEIARLAKMVKGVA